MVAKGCINLLFVSSLNTLQENHTQFLIGQTLDKIVLRVIMLTIYKTYSRNSRLWFFPYWNKMIKFHSDIMHKNGTPTVGWSINRRAQIQNFIKKFWKMKEYMLLETTKWWLLLKVQKIVISRCNYSFIFQIFLWNFGFGPSC